MKVYVLKEEDIERLISVLVEVNRNKLRENYQSADKVMLAEDIHRSYNYYIQNWIQEIKK